MKTDDVAKAAQVISFEDAKQAVSEQMAEAPVEEAPVEEAPVEVAPVEDTPVGEAQAVEQIAEEAVETADVAANVAAEKDQQLQEALAKIEQLAAENEQIKAAAAQASELQKEALVKPVLNTADMLYDDDETIAAKTEQYEQELKQYWAEMEKREISEKSNILGALSQIPELEGFQEMLPQIENIIENNNILNSPDIPLDEKYITAYVIANGVNAKNQPKAEPAEKELSTEQLLELYKSNPEFQAAIASQKKEAISEGQQVPPFSASSGAGNAALNIPEKAKTFEEAKSILNKMFN